MDAVTRCLIGLIEDNGYRVSIHHPDGKTEAIAHNLTTDDLAEQVGIVLEDG